MALTGLTGAVYTTDVDTAPSAFADKPTTADAERKRYQITDPTLRYWDPDTAVVVKVDAVTVDSGFTLEGAGGYVVFEEAQGAETVVTVSGKALTLEQAGGCFSWSVDMEVGELDATTFASGGWREFLPSLKEWSGSAEAFWGDELFFAALGKTVVVKLYVDSGVAQTCLEGYAVITAEGVDAPVDGLVEEGVEFRGVGPLYARGFEE